jgi:glycosyltransferase involved in cell wall biosynthesis
MSSDEKETMSVVVPCLNEEGNVADTVEGICALAPELPVEVEVVMVDDGSTDDTRVIMEDLERRFDRTRLIAFDENQGAGRAALRAFETIPSDNWVTCFPGDNEMVFESIRNFLDVRESYDLILGYLQNPVIRPIARRAASSLFMSTARLLYGYDFRYLNGIKLYRRWVFEGIDVVSKGHAINAELMAKAILRRPHLRVGEAPFAARGRARGTSKAFRPGSILTAARETVTGYRSVVDYRKKIIRGK